MKNIVLVGFMGTGKTTIARGLSKNAGMKYISTDEMIEKKEGVSINEIFTKKGEPYFRNAEKEVIAQASNMDNVVIDAGGGAVLNNDNIESLKNKGILVCLWAEPKDIFERTKKYTHRPLLKVRDPLKKIEELLDKRRPYYERADYHVNTSSVNIKEAISTILRFAKKENG